MSLKIPDLTGHQLSQIGDSLAARAEQLDIAGRDGGGDVERISLELSAAALYMEAAKMKFRVAIKE